MEIFPQIHFVAENILPNFVWNLGTLSINTITISSMSSHKIYLSFKVAHPMIDEQFSNNVENDVNNNNIQLNDNNNNNSKNNQDSTTSYDGDDETDHANSDDEMNDVLNDNI